MLPSFPRDLCEELLTGEDRPRGGWLTMHMGKTTTLQEKEGDNRQEGRAFRNTSSNGVVAEPQPAAFQGSVCEGAANGPCCAEDLRNGVVTTTRRGHQEERAKNRCGGGACKATVHRTSCAITLLCPPLSPARGFMVSAEDPFS